MSKDNRRLPVPSESKSPYLFVSKDKKPTVLVDENHLRSDGRKVGEIRPIYIRAGAVSQARGSAYIEMGQTKVLCAVYGPREVTRREDFSMKGQLKCELKFATFSRRYRCQHQSDNTEKDLSMVLRDTLEPAVCLDRFPRSHLDIFVTVLEDGGSALAAAITCASVAIARGGIEMYDLVIGMTVYDEPPTDNGTVTVGWLPCIEQISGLTQRGQMDISITKECLKQCVASCQKMYPVIQQTLIKAHPNKLE
ncbi:hypothetical protein LSH36_95g06000 [Paralvinella palmiformis]|uniref:Exoribonuclease phosphorolytic domain-containing protein n=1 Tax=Paralvinella palmiformis TaxID=53620 RepID=A0AAD9K150_9ANNE|nr:hypothetical protein LSH36_95g06000 [Paralvinella palmiformis]